MNAAGIVCTSHCITEISNCENTGNINSNSKSGGILSELKTTDNLNVYSKFKGCTNSGEIIAKGNSYGAAGGIISHVMGCIKVNKNDFNAYVISANLAEQNSNVDIQYNENDSEIIVTIKNSKKQEEVKPITKTFDLEINKSISEVKLNIDGKEKVEKADGNKLIKIDIPKSKINSSSAEITYKIEVKNIGELPGYVSELTDIIPENMELIESDSWKLNGKIALSNAFEGETLNPGESFVTYITFNWKFNEENIGLKTNKASISGYFNDYGISDNGKGDGSLFHTCGIWDTF